MNPISGYSSPPKQPLKINVDVYDRQIQKLMETRAKLEEQKNNVTHDQDLDDNIRKERVKALVEQIQAIDTEINQVKIDKIKDKQEKASGPKDTKNANPSSDPGNVNQIAQNQATLDSIKTLNAAKAKFEEKPKILNNEMKWDRFFIENSTVASPEDKMAMLGSAEMTVYKAKREEINDANGKASALNKKIGELYGKLKGSGDSDKPEDRIEGQKGETVGQEEKKAEKKAEGKNGDKGANPEGAEAKSIDITV